MCSLVAHDRLQNNYQDDDISLGDKVIPKDATVKALQSLGATFNFIDIWLHTLIKFFLNENSLMKLQWVRCSKKYLKMMV